MKRLFALAICAASLTACMGRTPVPVATTEGYDEHLSCDQVRAEIDSNNMKANQLDNENRSAHNGNVATAVVGTIFFWPAYFALDTGTAERDEMTALRARNAHLSSLVTNRVCDRVGDAYASEGSQWGQPVPWSQWSANALATEPQHACKMPNGATLAMTDKNCAKAGGNIYIPN
jgi:hypothetical protein